jgi:hypothetical protein
MVPNICCYTAFITDLMDIMPDIFGVKLIGLIASDLCLCQHKQSLKMCNAFRTCSRSTLDGDFPHAGERARAGSRAEESREGEEGDEGDDDEAAFLDSISGAAPVTRQPSFVKWRVAGDTVWQSPCALIPWGPADIGASLKQIPSSLILPS